MAYIHSAEPFDRYAASGSLGADYANAAQLSPTDKARLLAYEAQKRWQSLAGRPLTNAPTLGNMPTAAAPVAPSENPLAALLGKLPSYREDPSNPASQINGAFPYRGGYSNKPTMDQAVAAAPSPESYRPTGRLNNAGVLDAPVDTDTVMKAQGYVRTGIGPFGSWVDPKTGQAVNPAVAASNSAISSPMPADPRAAVPAPAPAAQPAATPAPAAAPAAISPYALDINGVVPDASLNEQAAAALPPAMRALAAARRMAPSPTGEPATLAAAPSAPAAAASSAAGSPDPFAALAQGQSAAAGDGTVMIGGVAVPTKPPAASLPEAYDPSKVSSGTDPWKALMNLGLGMMAAGSKPGATLLGAAGEGGIAAMKQHEADQTRAKAEAFQKYQADMSRAQTQNQMDAASRQYQLSVGQAASSAAHQAKVEDLAMRKEGRDAQKFPLELENERAKTEYMRSLAATAGKGSYGTPWQPIQTDKGMVFYDPDSGRVANPGEAGFNATGLGSRNVLSENPLMTNYNRAVANRDKALKEAFSPQDKARIEQEFQRNPAVQASLRLNGASAAPANVFPGFSIVKVQ